MSGGSVGLAWRAGAVNIWSTKSYVVSPPVTPPRPENARTCVDHNTRNDQLRHEVALLT